MPRLALLAACLFGGLLAGLAGAAPASAQTVYLAFGDSITQAVGFDDCGCDCGEAFTCPCQQECGYPPRLETLLENAGETAEVINAGLGGERTPEAVSRLRDVLADNPESDVLLLMEGTNNVTRNISRETTLDDLDRMALLAEDQGLDVVHATLIPRPPDANRDADNELTRFFNWGIRQLAFERERELADPFEVFRTAPDQEELYFAGDDPVGHPSPDGFDLLAEIFFAVLQGLDEVPPVLGGFNPDDDARGVPPDREIRLVLFDFGTGIELSQTELLVEGEPVEAGLSGGSERLEIIFLPPGGFSDAVTYGYRTADRATPPNRAERDVATFFVEGFDPGALVGDVDADGRVDGADLVRLALAFGAVVGEDRYEAVVDLDGDGDVDGEDLARLASNFGRSAT